MPKAFDSLFAFTDSLAKDYLQCINDPTKYRESYKSLYWLTEYYETLKVSSRLSHQAKYAKDKLYEINKAYAEGYFGSIQKSQRKPKPGQANLNDVTTCPK